MLIVRVDTINRRFESLSKPKQSEIGSYNVILMPEAVMQFYMTMVWYFDRKSADLGFTPYHKQVGEKLFGEKFNLRSNIEDQNLTVQLFTPGGLVARSINWVKGGVIGEMPTDISYAQKIDSDPSYFCNFIIDGEDSTVEEMMGMVDNGLIINNLWYLRNVDTKTGEITGLTRDGVNYFENGEIKHSLTNLRFNEIPFEVTKRIFSYGKIKSTY